MKWERLCELGLELPEVEEGIWYRTPALKVRGKAFLRLKEDGQSVVFMLESVDEQEFPVAMERADAGENDLKFLYLDGREKFGHYLEYTWMTDAAWDQIRKM